MNAAELGALSAAVRRPAGSTGWRLTDAGDGPDGKTLWDVVPIMDGLRDGKPVFRGIARDAHRFIDLVEGSTPRSAHPSPVAERAARGEPDGERFEAPSPGDASRSSLPGTGVPPAPSPADPVRLCAGCDQPLPPDASARQLTHGGACRVAAWRLRHVAESDDAASDTGEADVTPPGPNLAGSGPSDPPTAPSRSLTGRSEESADPSASPARTFA